MIEPTETESKETLDAFADALATILTEDPELLHSARTPRRSAAPTKSAPPDSQCWFIRKENSRRKTDDESSGELRVASCEWRVASCEWRVRVASCEFASCEWQELGPRFPYFLILISSFLPHSDFVIPSFYSESSSF